MFKQAAQTQITEHDEQLASWGKAFAHPARVAILKLLAEQKSCICGDITDRLPLAQSTVSQHLKVLKKAGLIKGEVEGVRTCYCLNEQVIPDAQLRLTQFMETLRSCCPTDEDDSCN
ncbi:MAG: ArsR/SmtB family transcription factor [Bacteroidota bacterium]